MELQYPMRINESLLKNVTAILMVIISFFYQGDISGQCISGFKNKKSKSKSELNLVLLISDGGLNAQIIQCTDTTIKHGFGEVYPYDELYNSDINWDPDFEIDGIAYPITERKINNNEKMIIKNAMRVLQSKAFKDPYVIWDDYKYVLYVDNHKVGSAFTGSLDLEEFPSQFKMVIIDILSLAAPIYPNYGIP